MRRQTYRYLPSRRASPPLDRYLIRLLDNRGIYVCEQVAQGCCLKGERPRFEPAKFRVASPTSSTSGVVLLVLGGDSGGVQSDVPSSVCNWRRRRRRCRRPAACVISTCGAWQSSTCSRSLRSSSRFQVRTQCLFQASFGGRQIPPFQTYNSPPETAAKLCVCVCVCVCGS